MEITKNLPAFVYLLAVQVERLPMPMPHTRLLTGEMAGHRFGSQADLPMEA
jgi:hypothetical protein